MSDAADPTRSRIFAIGLNKTGTSSLHSAFEILGLRSVHWGKGWPEKNIQRAWDEGLPALHYVKDHDAYSDINPITEHFDRMDREYHGSKFILTIREEAPWLESRKIHVLNNQRLHAAGRYHGTWLEIDFERWKRERVAHNNKVRDYFCNRPQDLLVMDICAGDGFEKLCPFLGREIPADSFPWQNQTGDQIRKLTNDFAQRS